MMSWLSFFSFLSVSLTAFTELSDMYDIWTYVCVVCPNTPFKCLYPFYCLWPNVANGIKLWASEWWVCVGVGIKMWSYFSSLIYITDSYNEKRPGCHSRQSTKQKRCKAEGKSIRIFVTADRNSCKPNPKIQVMMLIFHFCVITLTTNLMSLKSRHQISSVFKVGLNSGCLQKSLCCASQKVFVSCMCSLC